MQDSHIVYIVGQTGSSKPREARAKEFYEQYYNKISNREDFCRSNDHTYDAEVLNDLIKVFGQEKFKVLFDKNAHSPNYFLEKYSAVTK